MPSAADRLAHGGSASREQLQQQDVGLGAIWLRAVTRPSNYLGAVTRPRNVRKAEFRCAMAAAPLTWSEQRSAYPRAKGQHTETRSKPKWLRKFYLQLFTLLTSAVGGGGTNSAIGNIRS